MYISIVEYGVFSYPTPEMEGWRFVRLEYHAAGPYAEMECHVWLPPHVDLTKLEDFLNQKNGGE